MVPCELCTAVTGQRSAQSSRLWRSGQHVIPSGARSRGIAIVAVEGQASRSFQKPTQITQIAQIAQISYATGRPKRIRIGTILRDQRDLRRLLEDEMMPEGSSAGKIAIPRLAFGSLGMTAAIGN
jgi:hypothetical protein